MFRALELTLHSVGTHRSTISGLVPAGRVERDACSRAEGSGAGSVSVSIPGLTLLNDSMVAGKGGVKASLWQNERVRFLVCFFGVFVCYFYYGILQETM